MMDLEKEELLTVSQMADLLYMSVNAVMILIDQDKTIPVIRIGGTWRIERKTFLDWGEMAYVRSGNNVA